MNYQEADRIVTIFSKELGKTQFIAKGARKLNSKNGGVLDLFIEGRFEVTNKSDLPMLLSAQMINWYPYLRKSLAHWQIAERAAKALMKATKDHDAHLELYHTFSDFLQSISSQGNPKNLWIQFLNKLLLLSGFGINLYVCQNCHKELDEKNIASHGRNFEGFLCEDCSELAITDHQQVFLSLRQIGTSETLTEANKTQAFLEKAFAHHFLYT